MAVKKFAINEIVEATGIVNGGSDQAYDISGLDKIRFAVENAGGTNEFELKVKIKGQSNFTTLVSLTGNVDQVVDVKTYDLLQINCSTFDGTRITLIGVGFKLGGGGGVTEYANFASFPPATGSGEQAWDASTNTLYYDEPSSSTWTAPSAGSVSLTDSYIGYGSVGDSLTGEADFTYSSTTNTLNVDNVTIDASLQIAGTTAITQVLDEDDLSSDASNALATQQSIKAYVDSKSAAKYTDTFIVGDWLGPIGGYYYIDVPEATHGKGTDPIVQVLEDVGGGSHDVVFAENVRVDASGNVQIQIAEIPDTRFAGKLIIL